MITNR